MIVYFADRELNIIATASTDLPNSIRITSDTKTDDLESGVKTFDLSVIMDDYNRDLIRENCCVGNFVLRSVDDENEFYTIIETEHDTNTGEYSMYCEDAGLDLLNTVVPSYKASAAHDMAWYINYYTTNYGKGWEIGLDESPSNTLTLEWDGESTLTERLISIATYFNCELGYSYEVDGLTVTKRFIDIYRERGNQIAQDNYYLNRQVTRISVKKSIADLATAFLATGGTPSGKSTPIDLSGADYSSDGTTTHSPAVPTDDYQIVGKQVRCLSAMEKWSSDLDSDGLLVRQYSYDTTNKQELFSHAVAELRKVVDETITYEVEFSELNARVGDRINIVDDQDELYVEARVLNIERSVTQDTITATLGEYVIKESGISDRLAQLAEQLRASAISATSVEISSSAGQVFRNAAIYTTLSAVVYYGDTTITNQSDLEDVFGVGVEVNWYNGGYKIDTGFSTTISSANATEVITVKVEV